MSGIKLVAAILLLIIGVNSSNAQTKVKAVPVEVYYFHATNRCVTCEAVEAVTKEAKDELPSNTF